MKRDDFDSGRWSDWSYDEDDLDARPWRPRVAPGKVTLTSRLPPGPPRLQARAEAGGGLAAAGVDPHAVAARGVAGSGWSLPHGDRIQAAFGRHDLGGVRAHVGGAAAEAAEQLGAVAFATGRDIAFASPPDLHTAAHEAAHVIQQRAGVSLAGGVGRAGDVHEQQADQVADAVVRGESAEPIFDSMTPAGGAARATDAVVQRKERGESGRTGESAEASGDSGGYDGDVADAMAEHLPGGKYQIVVGTRIGRVSVSARASLQRHGQKYGGAQLLDHRARMRYDAATQQWSQSLATTLTRVDVVDGLKIPGFDWLTFSVDVAALEAVLDAGDGQDGSASLDLSLLKIRIKGEGTLADAAAVIGPPPPGERGFHLTMRIDAEVGLHPGDLARLARMARAWREQRRLLAEMATKKARLDALNQRRAGIERDLGKNKGRRGRRPNRSVHRRKREVARQRLVAQLNATNADIGRVQGELRQLRQRGQAATKAMKAARQGLRTGAGRLAGQALARGMAKQLVKLIPVLNMVSIATDVTELLGIVWRLLSGAAGGSGGDGPPADAGVDDGIAGAGEDGEAVGHADDGDGADDGVAEGSLDVGGGTAGGALSPDEVELHTAAARVLAMLRAPAGAEVDDEARDDLNVLVPEDLTEEQLAELARRLAGDGTEAGDIFDVLGVMRQHIEDILEGRPAPEASDPAEGARDVTSADASEPPPPEPSRDGAEGGGGSVAPEGAVHARAETESDDRQGDASAAAAVDPDPASALLDDGAGGRMVQYRPDLGNLVVDEAARARVASQRVRLADGRIGVVIDVFVQNVVDVSSNRTAPIWSYELVVEVAFDDVDGVERVSRRYYFVPPGQGGGAGSHHASRQDHAATRGIRAALHVPEGADHVQMRDEGVLDLGDFTATIAEVEEEVERRFEEERSVLRVVRLRLVINEVRVPTWLQNADGGWQQLEPGSRVRLRLRLPFER